MNSREMIGLLFVVFLLFTAACSSKPVANRTGITLTDTPTLPEEYNAQAVVNPAPISKHIVTINATPPVLAAYAQTTINGTGISGNSTNTTNSSSSGVIIPVASFASTTPAGFIPFAVQFTDTSQNQPTSWSWDFGDGGTSDLQNPVHTYTAGGRFNINLSATNAAGTGTMSAANFISVYAPGFYGTPVSGNHPLTVIFTDTGYGYPAPSSWFWDFGDGMTSSLANTSHQYTSAGLFNVSHRVTSPSGAIWVNRTGYILVA